MKELLNLAINASLIAGKEILAVYHNDDFGIEFKGDTSPLTLADKNAHKVIVGILEKTGIPILSEEGKSISYEERRKWEKFWLVDPLDGTKEFINRNGEFTVNIALINKGTPVIGIIYVPVKEMLYFSDTEKTYRVKAAPDSNFSIIENNKEVLPLRKEKSLGIVASKSHLNDDTKQFIEKYQEENGKCSIVPAGSSLKFCVIAEGNADVYPRLGPTMEWDTAAGDCLVRTSGGKVYEFASGKNLSYNKENLLNPYFVAESSLK